MSRRRRCCLLSQEDNVPADVKQRRLAEIIAAYHEKVHEKTRYDEMGKYRLVLVEGPGTKFAPTNPVYTGRTDGNRRVVFSSKYPVLTEFTLAVKDYFDNLLDSALYRDHMAAVRSAEAANASVGDIGEGLVAGYGALSSSESKSKSPEYRSEVVTNVDINVADASTAVSSAPAPTAAAVNAMEKAAGNDGNPGESGNEHATSFPHFIRARVSSAAENLQLDSLPSSSLVGRYIVVKIVRASGATLTAIPVAVTTLSDFHKISNELKL